MKKTLATIGLTILGIIALILIFVFAGSAGVTGAANEVLTHFENGEIREVYEQSIFTDELTFEEFQEALLVGEVNDMTKAEKLSWTGRGFQGDIKYVTGRFKLPSGQEDTITMEFVKEDGELVLFALYPGEQQ